jgi:hypothetical protein
MRPPPDANHQLVPERVAWDGRSLEERAMGSRANRLKTTITTVAAVAVLSCLAGTAPAAAGSSEFYVTFRNQSGALLEAVILHSNGDKQKSAKLAPGKAHSFLFGAKCSSTHSRKFEVWELVGDSSQIGSGSFSMTTQKAMGEFKVSCKSPEIKEDSCTDLVDDDDYSVTCQDPDGGVNLIVEIK